jgi:trehalose/maltose transport system substrate-binding protein
LVLLGGRYEVSFHSGRLAAALISVAQPSFAANISISASSTGKNLELFRKQLDAFEKATGNKDVDVYQTDVIWAPQLADQFVDLKDAAKDVVGDFFPSIIASQTVNGRLVAMPLYTDAPALFYRKDLLDKYGKQPPKTWDEMAATAKEIQEKERAAGQKDLWGYVFQGNAYEGLTCNALEWVKSSGGGQIIEPDGTISVNNENAAAALDRAKGWIGTISPSGVLAYQEEESRGVWQTGNAVFMRNWPYAYSLGNGADSAVKGKFDVTTLPVAKEGDSPSSTLGGWNLAVSKYSQNQDAAIALVKFLTSKESQKQRAIELSNLPTLQALYDDKDIAAAQPFMPNWKPIFQNAVPRPSASAKVKYNEVSSKFWTAVHNSLSGNGTSAENLELLEADLTSLKGENW